MSANLIERNKLINLDPAFADNSTKGFAIKGFALKLPLSGRSVAVEYFEAINKATDAYAAIQQKRNAVLTDELTTFETVRGNLPPHTTAIGKKAIDGKIQLWKSAMSMPVENLFPGPKETAASMVERLAKDAIKEATSAKKFYDRTLAN
jgi:hypothetical protein